ncbi:MAG TPA: conjugal transfer protein [Solirubrobacteraceae bacterium]|nr:conjugal transfer protein [Solirubrobacteraceae bacterium]
MIGAPRVPFRMASLPLWRHRVAVEARRWVLSMLALAGIAASARYAIAPPRPAPPRVGRPSELPDRPAEGFALLFARRYLQWRAAVPEASTTALASFTAGVMEPAAGLVPPTRGAQAVEWASVVGAREPQPGFHVYTIAAQTDAAGVVYLSVDVRRAAGGGLALWGYPAFVGPPASEAPQLPKLRETSLPALETVVVRALRNYLAGSGADLAADLAPGASVSLPTIALTLVNVQHLGWAPAGSSVETVVTARDARGTQYTLEYEIDVVRAEGRWEVAAVQTDPSS